MDIRERPYLRFDELAKEWARELEDSKAPGRRSHDEIFLELVRAVWRCEFEDENGENSVLTIHQYPEGGASVGHGRYVDADHQRTDPIQVPINRRWLLAAMPPIAGIRLPAKPRLRPSAGDVDWKLLELEIPWDRLIALELNEYDHWFRKAPLTKLMISKENFRRWCDDHGHLPPAFWFGQIDPTADGPTDIDIDQPKAATGQNTKTNAADAGDPAHSARPDNETSEPARNRPGRPSFAADIVTAYQTLKDRGKIDFAMPMSHLYPDIRLEVRTSRKLDSDKGLGDEVIRQQISSLFERDKAASKNL